MRFTMIYCLFLLIILAVNASAKIVFETTDGIYIMDDDGSNVTRLTEAVSPGPPCWSPDGTQIVFTKRHNPKNLERRHIYLMNADGTDLRQLTTLNDSLRDSYPSFAPDGKSIVFGRLEIIENRYISYICVMDIESGHIKLKKTIETGVNDPEFTPDGRHIVFSGSPSLGQSGANIWIMDADGRTSRQLLPPLNEGNSLLINRFDAKFSPDGTQMLYFQSETTFERIDGVGHIIPQAYRYIVYNLITGQSKELSIPKNYKPSGVDWMDGSNAIVFSAWQIKLDEVVQGERNYDIFKYDILRGELTQLTDDVNRNDYQLDWISDDVLSVTPLNKKKVQWGALKQ